MRLRWREMSFIEPSRAHLCRREAPVDGSLGHLGRAGSNINKQAPPAGGRADAGTPKSPKTTDRRRRRARFRRDAPLHGLPWNLGPGHDKLAGGRASSQQERGLHLYFLHPWDSGQEITGVQGMSPAAYIQTLDRCRRRWRRLVAGAVAVRGKGGISTGGGRRG